MKRLLLLTVSYWLLAVGCLYAYKKESIDITLNGTKRNMVVFTPNTFSDNVPLMVITHGMNQDPEYQYGSDKMYELIDTAKFVVVYPRGTGNSWDIGGDTDKNFIIRVISEMQSRYGIDTNRVYWSGFSMGSMLIYHCMPTMTDRIAAFAPTSGVQFSEQPWNNLKKHVNLIECTAYGDDVFGYEEYGIHDYVLNIAKKNGYTKYLKKSGYKTKNGTAWFDGLRELWKNEEDGSEVVLFSFNNGGHWPMAENSYEIWNFCKRFSLDPGIPAVKFDLPSTDIRYTSVDTVEVKVTATDQDGYIASIKLYVDGTLIKTEAFDTQSTDKTYTLNYRWIRPVAKTHTLKAIVIDNDGKKKEVTKSFTVEKPDPLQLLSADPEDLSFDLSTDIKRFTYTFDWRVNINKINAYLTGIDTIPLTPAIIDPATENDSLSRTLALLVSDDRQFSEGNYKLWIKNILDERLVRASTMMFKYSFGITEVDPDNPDPKTPAEIYKGGFMKAYAEGLRMYDVTSVEKYIVADMLREPLKAVLDKYDGFASTAPSVYTQATDEIKLATDTLKVRVHNLDSLYSVIDEANGLLEQYKDDPVISAKDIYSKLQKCVETYSKGRWLQSDVNIIRAIASVKNYIIRFRAAVVTGIADIADRPTADSQQPTYSISGQAVDNGYKGIVIRNGRKELVR